VSGLENSIFAHSLWQRPGKPPRKSQILQAGPESTLKVYSRKGDEIMLTPIETKRHLPRTFHATRIRIQGVLVEIARRVVRRKR
jgi:SOS-response transcriptional repressor LexA